MLGRGRRALRGAATSSSTGSCSTASPAPWCRPRRSVGFATIDVAVDLQVPEDVVLERISSRRVCTNCGRIYSTVVAAEQQLDLRHLRGRGRATGRRHAGGRGQAPRRLHRRDPAHHRLVRRHRHPGRGRRPRHARRGHRPAHRRHRRPPRGLSSPDGRPLPRRAAPDARRRPGRGRDARADPGRDPARGHHRRARPHRPRGHREARCPLQLPRVPRLPGGDLRVTERRDRPRHPRPGRAATRATSSRSTAGRSCEGWHGDAAFTAPGGAGLRRRRPGSSRSPGSR